MASFETFNMKAHKESWADQSFRGEITVTGTFTRDEWDRLTQLFAQLSRTKKLPAYEPPKQIGQGRTVAEQVMDSAEAAGTIIPHSGS